MEHEKEVLLERHEYDISNAEDLERELRVLCAGATTIDMAKVRYMDTTALRSLIRIGQDLSAKGRVARIVLKNTHPSMRRIFEVVGLGKMFEIK